MSIRPSYSQPEQLTRDDLRHMSAFAIRDAVKDGKFRDLLGNKRSVLQVLSDGMSQRRTKPKHETGHGHSDTPFTDASSPSGRPWNE